ncbi:hypothetical protein IU501_18655 [Nocardia otitidiscaviarum]|uniref:membrane protein n=1 Tax=Nocardia otitidiscaviarum TaxID=1823 RepID=UPI0004A6CA4F|nr:membrane protein [Nocardia otitidiscaviarum]MBF6135016.1 hypothetical protein [Nocardia otitidiscaviarum]MBF6485381.1 hypothetical protein [Nocardia otitidiscaviarum]
MHAIAAVTLGLFLCAVGISHFAFPAYFRKLVPSRLTRPGLLVAGSGIAEMVIGAGLVLPITRELAGWPALALLSVYLLVWVRRLHTDRLNRPMTVTAGVVVNAVYVIWAAYVAVVGR